MSSQTGKNLKLNLFGESHGASVGCLIEGLPSGFALDLEKIEKALQRRRPGYDSFTSTRKETDDFNIISGFYRGKTTGTPLVAIFANQDAKSKDYEKTRYTPRPSHADYSAFVRYKNFHDVRGGGHFSARLTAPWCFAGAIAEQILAEKGIVLAAHLKQVGKIQDKAFSPESLNPEVLSKLKTETLPLINSDLTESLIDYLHEIGNSKDSVGGIIELAALGLPAGFGNPIFDNIESRLAYDLFAIPGIKGVEFGSGFQGAEMKGSEHNDPWYFQGEKVLSRSNHHGGVLGGITTGMPLILRVVFKPTSSIGKKQETVNLKERTREELLIEGRHDPCIAIRGLPVVEAAVAFALADFYLFED